MNNLKLGENVINSLNSSQVTVTNKDYSASVPVVICKNCKLVQPKYILNCQEIVSLYSKMGDSEYLRTSDLRTKSNYDQIIKTIKHKNSDSKILEIGSGSGGLLRLLKNIFPNSIGIEPSRDFCKFAETKYGLKIKNTGFESFNTKYKYDIVIALDVIEHVASPRNFFKKTSSLLNKNGILVLGTPNISSFMATILKKRWWHIRPPHLFYFNKENLKLIANNYGFSLKYINSFYWSLPLNYVIDSVEKLLFGKTIIKPPKNNIKIKVNTYDSNIFVFKKK